MSASGSATKPKKSATEILTYAADIVAGARNLQHGEKERSFILIGRLWTTYLEGRKVNGEVTPRDVAQMMVLLKMARSIQGDPVTDHFVDQAGYSGIAGELAAQEGTQTQVASPTWDLDQSSIPVAGTPKA